MINLSTPMTAFVKSNCRVYLDISQKRSKLSVTTGIKIREGYFYGIWSATAKRTKFNFKRL